MNPMPSALYSDSLHFDLLTLSPLILLAGSAVAVMLAAAFYRHPRPVMMLTLAGLVLSFASLFLPQGIASRSGNGSAGTGSLCTVFYRAHRCRDFCRRGVVLPLLRRKRKPA